MKKILILPAVLMMMCACGGKSADEQAAEQKQHDDSIAAAVRAEEAAKAAELARLDSLRQDSIKRIENFRAAIPTFAEVNDYGDYAKLFKTKGYTITYGKGEGWDNEILQIVPVKTVIANLKLDDQHSCSFREFCSFENGVGWKMTINGAPEELEKFAAAAKSFMNGEKAKYPNDWYYGDAYVKQAGNTVTYRFPMGD